MLDATRIAGTTNSYLNPTLRRLLAALRMDHTWERAEGVWVVDSSGRRFLDCYAQYGALALGHNAPGVRSAVQTALEAREPVMVQPYRARYAEALAEKISEVAPGDLSRGVFTSSGAEAVEAAIKLVRARTGRPVIVSTIGSFHGKTLGALAVTGQRQYAEGFGPPPPGFEHIEFGDADALEARFSCDREKVAAFFVEPIQGEGGVHIAPPGYLERVRELCTRFGVLLVLDEIQTGLGRTGRLFACEHDRITPDVLLIGKALGGGFFPLSGCFTTAACWDERFALAHSSTFANHNLACRVGLTVLEELTRGGLCALAARRGERLQERLGKLARRYPRVVATVRGRGLMGAIELCRPAKAEGTLLSFLSHQGLYAYAVAATIAESTSVLVLPTLGDTDVIRVTPPLTISEQELDIALDGVESVCRALDRDATSTIVRAIGALDVPSPEVDTEIAPPLLPARVSTNTPAPEYAFLVHYTCPEDLAITNPALRRLDRESLENVCAYTSGFAPGVLLQSPRVRSATGSSVDGLIIALPMLPEEMARRGYRRVARDVERAVELAARLGARIVGLGGYTAPYSRRGLTVTGRGPAITTGNALTAGMAVRAIRQAAAADGLRLSEMRVAVVGARGSTGSLCARLLAREQPRRLVLVGNPDGSRAPLDDLAETLAIGTTTIEVATRLSVLRDCEIVLTATTAPNPLIHGSLIAPGSIVCDVARPPDTCSSLRDRRDLTVIDGGRVALPDPEIEFGVGNLNNLPAGVTLACLAETILLALAGETRDFGVGYDVSLDEVDHVIALAERHGFHLAPLPVRCASTGASSSALPCPDTKGAIYAY